MRQLNFDRQTSLRGCALETELSDFHIMVLTKMTMHFSKKK